MQTSVFGKDRNFQFGLISILVIFIFLVGWALWTTYSSQLQVRESARNLFVGESNKRAMAVSSFLAGRRVELESLADLDLVKRALSASGQHVFNATNARTDDLKNIYKIFNHRITHGSAGNESLFSKIVLVDSANCILVNSDNEGVVSDQEAEKSSIRFVQNSVSYFTCNADGTMALVVSLPVLGPDRQLAGHIGAWIKVESLHENLNLVVGPHIVGSDFLRVGDSFVALSSMAAQKSGELLLLDLLREWEGLTVLKDKYSSRDADYIAISSPVYGTPLSVISLVEENKIFGSLSAKMHFLIALFIFCAVVGGCYAILRVIMRRQLYEARIVEAARREKAVQLQKDKLENEIQHRKRADRMRLRAEVRYREIFDNAPVGIFQISMDGVYITANDSLAKIFGYGSHKDLIRAVKDVREDVYVNPKDWDNGLALLHSLGNVSAYEVECYFADGSTVWTSRDFRLVTESGAEPYLEGFVIDITARKRAEQRLLANEKRFRSLFENSPVPLLEIDFSDLKNFFDSYGKNGLKNLRDDLLGNWNDVTECTSLLRILDSNNLANTFLGVSSTADLIHTGFVPYIPEDNWRFLRAIFLDFASGKNSHRSEVHFIREDNCGKFFIINCSIVAGFEKNWERVLVSIEDISEIKKVENELRISKNEAQKANEAKGLFLANMSHEFRTPMNAIKGIVQLMQNSSLDDEQQRNLRLIKSSTDGLMAIVNDILDYSKLDSVHMELNNDLLNLPAFLEEMRDIIDIGAMNKKMSVTLEIENIPQCVKVDSQRLRQVLINLLGNAVKFTDEGVVALKCYCPSAESFGEVIDIHFEVSDTGIGLPVDGAQELFKSFVQADPSITRKYGGTGLGLAISYKLIKHLGGELIARNNEQGGATFSFVLPLCVCSAGDSPESETLPVVRSDVDYSGLKILVAEDSRMNQILLRKIFEKNAITDYTIVENGKEAVDCMKKTDFNIIFMDIQMPVMDGFAATSAIRAFHSPVRIVALTSNGGVDYLEKCYESGMDSRILKPFNVEELLRELDLVAAGK